MIGWIQRRLRGTDPERGAATSLEMVVLAPVMMAVLALLLFAGRYAMATTAVEQAANASARAASITRTQTQATTEALNTATTTLANNDLTCAGTDVAVDSADFALPPGSIGTVGVTVTCTLNVSDLVWIPLPSTVTISHQAQSVLDTHRSAGG